MRERDAGVRARSGTAGGAGTGAGAGGEGSLDHKALEVAISELLALCRVTEEYNQVRSTVVGGWLSGWVGEQSDVRGPARTQWGRSLKGARRWEAGRKGDLHQGTCCAVLLRVVCARSSCWRA